MSSKNNLADQRAAPRPWLFWILLGSGVFIGSFWMILGFLNALDNPGSWWQYVRVLAPGCAVLLLVLQAGQAPLPFGTALIVLGLLPLGFWQGSHGLWLRLVFGLPLMLLGAGFIWWQRHPHIRHIKR